MVQCVSVCNEDKRFISVIVKEKQPCALKLNDGAGMRKITEGNFFTPEWTAATTTCVSRMRDTPHRALSVTQSMTSTVKSVRMFGAGTVILTFYRST